MMPYGVLVGKRLKQILFHVEKVHGALLPGVIQLHLGTQCPVKNIN